MKIVTDCAADMPIAELESLGITQAPLFIQFPEGEANSIDLSPDDFYDRLKAMYPAIPTTAQPSPGIFAEIYRKLAAEDKDIFSVHISSGLSGVIEAARSALSYLEEGQANVTLWDTLTLSGGERFQVMAAALAFRAGWTLEAIQERLQEIRTQTEVIYTLETLEYLAKGGRIGRVQALAGTLLNLKPVICVDHVDGKYNNTGRSRSLPRALENIANQLQHIYAGTPLWVTVLHGKIPDQAEALAREIRGRLNVARIETLRVSPVLGVHTGPAIVGAALVPIRLLEDLL